MNNELEERLARLFQSVRAGWATKRAGSTYNSVSQAGVFHLESGGYELMRSLRKELSSPALGGRGFSTVAVRAVLGRACRVFLDEGQSAALEFVRNQLDAPQTS